MHEDFFLSSGSWRAGTGKFWSFDVLKLYVGLLMQRDTVLKVYNALFNPTSIVA